MGGRVRKLGAAVLMVAAALSVLGTSLRRATVDEELPRAALGALAEREGVVGALGAPLYVVRHELLSWEQDEMDAQVTARMLVAGPRGATWVDVSGWSIAGLPWQVQVMEVRPAFAPRVRAGW